MEGGTGELLYEIRTEFQIPPFFPDDGLKNYIQEGKARLLYLNPGRDWKKDMTFRSLLKNYVYYAYHHKIHEWEKNYENLIVSWQMGSEVIT